MEVSQFPLDRSGEMGDSLEGSRTDSQPRWLSFVMFLDSGKFLKTYRDEEVVARPGLNDAD